MIFEAYRRRRVLVTGHTGFKGGWLCWWLHRLGSEVGGLSLAPEDGRPSLFEASGLAGSMTSWIGDITDPALVARIVADWRPEIIFHLAAQPLVRRSYRAPLETFAANVMGTAHVLEAVRTTDSVRAVVCVTTDKVYHNNEWAWGYREDDRLGGKDPYSASKAAAELVAACYQQTLYAGSGVALATARGGNVVGGGDWSEDRLVPDLVRSLETREKIVLRNPGAVRPWQHVLELVRGYLVLGEELLAGRGASAWNFGPGQGNEVTVERLVESFLAAWGEPGVPVEIVPAALPEAHFLKLDNSRARSELAWMPVLDFPATIALTAEWYRRHAAGECAQALVAEQIAAFERRT